MNSFRDGENKGGGFEAGIERRSENSREPKVIFRFEAQTQGCAQQAVRISDPRARRRGCRSSSEQHPGHALIDIAAKNNLRRARGLAAAGEAHARRSRSEAWSEFRRAVAVPAQRRGHSRDGICFHSMTNCGRHSSADANVLRSVLREDAARFLDPLTFLNEAWPSTPDSG